MDGIARRDGADGVARRQRRPARPTSTAPRWARRRRPRRRRRPTRSSCRRGATRWCSSRPPWRTCCRTSSFYGFNGKRYAERQSFAEPGAAQFDRAVTVVDDPLGAVRRCRSTRRAPADGALTLVEAGTTRAVAHDRRTAAEAGAESTGHAVAGGATWGPIAAQPAAARRDGGPGQRGRPEHHRRGGRGGRRRGHRRAGRRRTPGLLVTDLWYTRVLDPKSLVVTGLTRNGVWLIEDGNVVRAVRDLRFTESYPRALGPGAVLGLGARAVRQPDRVDGAWWAAPSLRLASWHFTGGASG